MFLQNTDKKLFINTELGSIEKKKSTFLNSFICTSLEEGKGQKWDEMEISEHI